MDETTLPTARFDETTTEQEAGHLPEDMRDSYRWLKTFCREECNRDIHRLTDRFRAVGVEHDATTWSKILRGLWNRNSGGAPLPSPVISMDRFLKGVERLRADVRSGASRGRVGYVQTTSGTSMMDFMDRLRASDRVNKFGVIVGPTGSQKSATFIEYALRINHGTIRHAECPENGAMGEFTTVLASAFGFSKANATCQKRTMLLGCVRPHHCLIMDNAQDLWRDDDTKQPAFSFLRRLQDVSGCTIILSITNTFERQLMGGLIRGYFEQFEGRSGGRKKWLRLPEYAPEEDVLMIAKAFGLADPQRHLKDLVEISREPGRIRRLFEDLQEAKILSNAEKAKLTIDHIRAARGED